VSNLVPAAAYALGLTLVVVALAAGLAPEAPFGRNLPATGIGAAVPAFVLALLVLRLNGARPFRLLQGVGLGVLTLFLGHFLFVALDGAGGNAPAKAMRLVTLGAPFTFPLFILAGLAFAAVMRRRA